MLKGMCYDLCRLCRVSGLSGGLQVLKIVVEAESIVCQVGMQPPQCLQAKDVCTLVDWRGFLYDSREHAVPLCVQLHLGCVLEVLQKQACAIQCAQCIP